ncbi:MAG: hypothetical protein EXR79_10725 [Myxococcales bacterium]|nr:hypothetical protein [Myxococcales bacterium]
MLERSVSVLVRGAWTIGRRAAGLGLAAAVFFATAFALPAGAVPAQVQIAGALRAQGGGPAADGGYKVTFALYAAEEAPIAEWFEGPVVVQVKDGLFGYALGTTKPIGAVFGTLAKPWIGVQFEGEPEFTRRPVVATPYALRAGVADGVECSGCITAQHLDPKAFGDFAKLSGLAKVALSGAWSDLAGVPDLSQTPKKGDFAAVAFTGKYADLNSIPVSAKVGTACGTGLVVQGIKADGTLECTGGGAALFGKDALEKASQGALSNLIGTFLPNQTPAQDVPDNSPLGVGDFIDVPDLGAIEAVLVHVVVTNSDFNNVVIKLQDPLGNTHQLWNGGSAKAKLDTSFPKPTALAVGDFSGVFGKNPKGKWALFVIDTGFLNNAKDGQLVSWDLTFSTFATNKVQVAGDLTDKFGFSFARTGSATSDVLDNGKTLALKTSATTPAVQAQAWFWDTAGNRWIQANTGSATASNCSACGTGANGAYTPTQSGTLAAGTYNYTKFVIPKGVVITVTGGSALQVKASEKVDIAGTLVLDGGAGSNVNNNSNGCLGGQSSPGAAGPGGAAGGFGVYADPNSSSAGGGQGPGQPGTYNFSGGCGGGGGGAGHNGNGANGNGGKGGGANYDSVNASSLVGGSGGGAGGYGSAYNATGGGGGGGGGALRIDTPELVVSGTITANGGNGGAQELNCDGGGGGGGSGGAIWLRGSIVTLAGATITALAGQAGPVCALDCCGGAGGSGATGRIRIDSTGKVAGTTNPTYLAGDAAGLAPPVTNRFRIDQSPAGTVVLTNESGVAQKVWLVASW